MFRNYLKIAFRNFLKHKGYSFINITGLAVGLTCSIFLLLWVQDELNYNHCFDKLETLYRLEQDQKSPEGNYHVTVTPFPVGPELKTQFPEIKNSTRYWGFGTQLIRYQDKAFFENGIRAVDPSFLDMFSIPLLKGNFKTALNEPHSLIISETMRIKYFGDEDPINKTITINNTYIFKITGVMKDFPASSSIQGDMLVPFDFIKEIGRYRDSWASNTITTWVELPNQSNSENLNKKITNLIYEHSSKDAKDYKPDFWLMPFKNIRLYGYFGFGQLYGTIQSVYIFSGLAIFILLIACINFMNLATARSTLRAKEVGLRKVVGAHKRNIIWQFYGESILITFISLFFSLILVFFLLGEFNDLANKKFTFTALFNSEFVLGLFSITVLTGIISGSYPALFLSSFQPIKVLKGKSKNSSRSGFFRKFLVVTQFCLSIILVLGTIVVFQQVEYMRNKKIGYDKEQLIYLPLRGETKNSYSILKETLLNDPRVLNVSGTSFQPTFIGSNSWGAEWDGKDPNRQVLISTASVDFNYVETYRIELKEGRSFLKQYSTDTATAFLINEEVEKLMGTNSAVGKRFNFNGREGTIIGVMKNFHYQSTQRDIEPLAVVVRPERVTFAVLRLQGNNIQNSLEYVRSTWQKLFPLYPFEYKFFDEDFDRLYKSDENMASILEYASILAILIACLGLFGLASYMAEQRTKEIGVRKILGCTVPGIIFLLSKEFIKWVIAANIIAWPVGYFLMNKWLQDYANRIPLSWWFFGFAGFLSIVIALLTISYQSIKAARSNPVESLRYE